MIIKKVSGDPDTFFILRCFNLLFTKENISDNYQYE